MAKQSEGDSGSKLKNSTKAAGRTFVPWTPDSGLPF